MINTQCEYLKSHTIQYCQTSLACVLVSAPSLGPDPDNDSPNEAADDGMRIDAPPEYWGLHNSTMDITAVSNIETFVPFFPRVFILLVFFTMFP